MPHLVHHTVRSPSQFADLLQIIGFHLTFLLQTQQEDSVKGVKFFTMDVFHVYKTASWLPAFINAQGGKKMFFKEKNKLIKPFCQWKISIIWIV